MHTLLIILMMGMMFFGSGCKSRDSKKDHPKQRNVKLADTEKYVPQYPGGVDINELKPGLYIENPNKTFTPTDTIVLMPTPRGTYENKFIKTAPSGYILVGENKDTFEISFWKGENLIYSATLPARELGKTKATPTLRFFEGEEFGNFNSEKLGLHYEVPDGVMIKIE